VSLTPLWRSMLRMGGQILLRVRDRDEAGTSGVLQVMVRALHTHDVQAVSLE
jgi:hypothetical protein